MYSECLHEGMNSFLKLSFLGALLMGSAAVHAGPFEDACARQLAPTRISVVPTYAQPTGDYSKSYKDLSRESPLGGGARTLGVTEATLSAKTTYGYSGLSSDTNGCSRPNISMVLSFNPLKVYVGREFQAGTCEFKHVFDHEVRHVNANQAHLAHVARQLQNELTQYYGNRIFYGDPKVAGANLAKEINDVWLPRAMAWMDSVKHTHAQIDTPAEYARSTSACGGAIARIVAAGG